MAYNRYLLNSLISLSVTANGAYPSPPPANVELPGVAIITWVVQYYNQLAMVYNNEIIKIRAC